MGLELVVVGAFTDRPGRGNPAAVCLLESFLPDEALQSVAREMNLSETAFVVTRPDGAHDLRWFTPLTEVELCGHATLASAHVLGGPRCFHTRSGPLTCAPAEGGWIEMDFPADRLEEIEPARWPALGSLDPLVRRVLRGREDLMVEIADGSSVRSLQADPAFLEAVVGVGTRAVIVTAPGDRPGIDCVSRVFGPNVGIPEDPVTGSAHCTLAEHWGARTGKDELVGEQASPRGGTVRMRRAPGRVVIGGQAVTVSRVTLGDAAINRYP